MTVAETSGCHKFLSPSNSKGFLFVTSPMRKTSTLDARVRFSRNVVRYVRREVYTVQSGGSKLESESGGFRFSAKGQDYDIFVVARCSDQ